MTESALRELLKDLAAVAADQAILWRGGELDGSDVDLLVLPGARRTVASFLHARGLSPEPGDPGHVVWTGRGLKPVDVLDGAAWPHHYPPLGAVVERLVSRPGSPPEIAPEDRLLILAAEAVTGRPVEKVVRRARPLLERDGVPDRLAQRAREHGATPLAELIADPGALEGRARRGRLPYPQAARVALRSQPARHALMARAAGRASAGRMPPVPRGVPQRLLISLSGMDGAGKSTAAEAIRERLEEHGVPARIEWARIGGESRFLDAVAEPVKKLLRRQGTVADPVAAGGPDIGKVQDPRAAAGARTPVWWAWVVIVAAANASSYRRAARRRRGGESVVSDRWVVDAVVDLELRYGRHPIAARVLRWLAPSTDLSLLLVLDAATAAARKPGDQALHVLEGMEARYAEEARRGGLEIVDAAQPPDAVRAAVLERVDALIERAHSPLDGFPKVPRQTTA